YSSKKDFHIFQRVNRHAALADFTFARCMVRVVAHQSGQVERHGKPSAAMLQQIFVTLIRFLWRRESRELPHCVKLAAIPSGVYASGKRGSAGISQIFFLA